MPIFSNEVGIFISGIWLRKKSKNYFLTYKDCNLFSTRATAGWHFSICRELALEP
jgi:hypothetical protein